MVPFAVACGHCWFCERGFTTHCQASNPKHYGAEGAPQGHKGGGLLGHGELYGGYGGWDYTTLLFRGA